MPSSRPAAVEREGTHRAITMSEIVDVPILLVHVSSAEAVEQIRWAPGARPSHLRRDLPQHLSPPPSTSTRRTSRCQVRVQPAAPRGRQPAGGVERPGNRRLPGRVLGPCGLPVRRSRRGRSATERARPFTKIPNGVPGVELRLPLLFSEGVGQGRIDLAGLRGPERHQCGQALGPHPRKGTIAVGSDADLAIWDPEREVVVTNDLLHHNCDYTPYEGMTVRGWPEITLSRGEVVVEEGKLLAEPGRGQFLRCDRPAPTRA